MCALEPRSMDSLGTQDYAKFESNTNRMTFEYASNTMIVKVHPQSLLFWNIVDFLLLIVTNNKPKIDYFQK